MSWISQEQVLRAIVLVVNHGVPAIPYNVGTGKAVSINRVYALLNKIIGTNIQAIQGPAKSGEQLKSVVSHTRITREIGWKPEVTLWDGLNKTVEYWRRKS